MIALFVFLPGNDYCNGKGEDERRDEELDKMLLELQTAEFAPPSGEYYSAIVSI